MIEVYHPYKLRDDYGNTWTRQPDGSYSSLSHHRWSLGEVRKVFGVSADQTPDVVRLEHEHNWISIRQFADLHDRQMCHCGGRRVVVESPA